MQNHKTDLPSSSICQMKRKNVAHLAESQITYHWQGLQRNKNKYVINSAKTRPQSSFLKW